MIEALRTVVVWLAGLSVHYVLHINGGFAETWTPYSYLQLIGFVVIVLGQAIYGRLIRIPGLTPDEAAAPSPSPSSPSSPIKSPTLLPVPAAHATDDAGDL